MSKFDIKSLQTSEAFFQDLIDRNDNVVFETTTSEYGELLLKPCWNTPWLEWDRNKFYFDDNPIDLPKNGKWKYRLPVTYNVSNKTFQRDGIDVVYPNVVSIKIEDGSRGGFRKDDHYFIRSNGEVWIKGSRPYLNLRIIVNWKANTGESNSTTISIPPEDFILNGKLVSVSNSKVRVPYRPCYEGIENVYEVNDYVLTWYRKRCETSLSNPDPSSDPNDIFITNYREDIGYSTGTFKEGIFLFYYTGNEPTVWYIYTNPDGTYVKSKDPADFPGIQYQENTISGVLLAGQTRIPGYLTKEIEYNETPRMLHLGGKNMFDEATWRELYDKKLWNDPKYFWPGQNYFFLSASLDTRVTRVKEYTNQTRFSDLVDCECIELNIITPPTVNKFLTPDCDCTVTVSEELYIICPDVYTDKAYNEYLNGRQTPPEIDDFVNKDDLTQLEPTYRRIITADPCEFGDDSSRVWQPFAFRDVRDVVKNEVDGLFDGRESIDCYTTSSVQNEHSKLYYYDVTECDICEVSKSYFSVSFGHVSGSGSVFESYEDEDSPSRSIYSQYRLKALDDFSENFTYYNNGTLFDSSMIYVMNFSRDSVKDRIDPGNFEIDLAELNGTSYANNVYTGSNVAVSSSNKILSLIDNSGDLTDTYTCSEKNTMYSFDIVSGSLVDGIHSSGVGTVSNNPNLTTYGKVYPNLGIVVLDGTMLDTKLNFNTVVGNNISGDNHFKLFTSLSGSAALGNPTKFRNSRQRNIKNYSVRIAPVECNFSNNPTYLKEYGRLKYPCFIENPVTYITSVGLYNSNRELLAVAKLSKPIKKTKDDTIDIKIRLGL